MGTRRAQRRALRRLRPVQRAAVAGRPHRDAEEASAAKDHEAAGPITLETEYLHVIPKTERAETDRRVTIHEPRGIIEAVGLDLDNKSKTAKLRSRVSGTFEPQTVKK